MLTGAVDSHVSPLPFGIWGNGVFSGPDLVMAELRPPHPWPLETGTPAHRGNGAEIWVDSKPKTDIVS
jgi:hypothetical protein